MITIPQKKEAPPVEPLAVSSVEACKLLGVSMPTLIKWTREGKLPHRRVGVRLLYSVEGLKAFAAGKDAELFLYSPLWTNRYNHWKPQR